LDDARQHLRGDGTDIRARRTGDDLRGRGGVRGVGRTAVEADDGGTAGTADQCGRDGGGTDQHRDSFALAARRRGEDLHGGSGLLRVVVRVALLLRRLVPTRVARQEVVLAHGTSFVLIVVRNLWNNPEIS